jgi:anti-sigma factor RsiW
MSQPYTCEEKDLLVAYLYDEAEPADRERVEAHLAECRACREEVDGLRAVRTTLAEWAPSTRALGFRLVQTDPVQEPRRRALWPLPAWAQAAAAVLVLGVAAGVANLDITVGTGGVIVRTGWQRTPAGAAAAPSRTAAAAQAEPWRADLTALEQRLRTDFVAQKTLQPAVGSPGAGAALGAAGQSAVMDQVRAIVADSEQRQQRELALRVAQMQRDLDGQRLADLKRIQDNMGQLGGWTGAEVARQRDAINYLLRVNSQQIK